MGLMSDAFQLLTRDTLPLIALTCWTH